MLTSARKILTVGVAMLTFTSAVSTSATSAMAQPVKYPQFYGGNYGGGGSQGVNFGPSRGSWGGSAPIYRGGGFRNYGYSPAYSYSYPAYAYGGYPYSYGGYYPYRRRSGSGALVAGLLLGGLALGAIAASTRPVYGNCWNERRRLVNRYGKAVPRIVRVCA